MKWHRVGKQLYISTDGRFEISTEGYMWLLRDGKIDVIHSDRTFNGCKRKADMLMGESTKDPLKQPCEEMQQLRTYLDDRKVKWFDRSDTVICRTHFDTPKGKVSVINGNETYGGIDGLLEMMIGNNAPVGWLAAKDVIKLLYGKEEG